MKKARLLSFLFFISLFLISCSQKSKEKSITISPQGGSYALFKGATLDVPPNAVSGEVGLTFRSIPKKELNNFSEGSFPLVAAFEALPAGQIFHEPISITLTDLNLTSGAIPLVRLIDQDQGNRILLGTEASYDPKEDTFSFELDHFTTIAVESGEEAISQTCKETPCRCGRISIEQSDSSQACSQDDCQVVESEVSVQFLDCPGQPVETSYFKEVSPTCTPGMELNADKVMIPPHSSTVIRATTKLSCLPIPEQSVDFSLAGPGELNPSFQITGQNGSARTNFSAGKDEGKATVNANASGSYYLQEIRANGESFNRWMKTYELSESVEVTIDDPVVTFDATFNGCNLFVCVENYQVSLEFRPGEEISGEEWWSTATVKQSGSISDNYQDPGLIFSYDMPAVTTLEVSGYYSAEAGEYHVFVYAMDELVTIYYEDTRDDSWDFYYEFVDISSENPPDDALSPFIFTIIGEKAHEEGAAYLSIAHQIPRIEGAYSLFIK